MVKKLVVIDEQGHPITGAVFTFIRNGSVLVNIPGNASGELILDTSTDSELFRTGVDIRVTAPGYAVSGVTADSIADEWDFTLAKSANLQTPLIIGAAIATLLLMTGTKKKNALGKLDLKELQPLVIPVAVVGVGIYLGSKLLTGLGFGKSAEQLATEKSVDDYLNFSPVPSTKTDAEWNIIADQIYTDLENSAVSNDKEDAGYQLSRPQNDTDVFKLIKSYGTRTLRFFGIPRGLFNLGQTVSDKLSVDKIAQVNDNYSRKGISFRW